jgi:hypothetical protein
MNNSSTSAVTSKKPESEISHIHRNKQNEDIITITETIKLKTRQHEVLKVICDTYRLSISEYIQEALIEAMTSDIEEGNFCETLLEKIDNDDNKSKNNNNSSHPPSPSPDSFAPEQMKNDLDLLKKLGTETLL